MAHTYWGFGGGCGVPLGVEPAAVDAGGGDFVTVIVVVADGVVVAGALTAAFATVKKSGLSKASLTSRGR